MRYDTIRYYTKQAFNVDSKAECDALYLAHETETKRHSPLSSVEVQDLWRQSGKIWRWKMRTPTKIFLAALWSNRIFMYVGVGLYMILGKFDSDSFQANLIDYIDYILGPI